ncbi:8-oxoguanine DNA glycosylase [Paraburkholderia largidicola]|uniref:Uncharacterized protein n=1 Tax=Paraburkholderia largidicola TaxID=3014751 RepID=A0A7I8C449_9BURK|nr:hypothetical protein [Paraburkholderia sp. PGU16]BCF95279.1 hypothetical protein PPGU16_83460 [Paraburkholderia sp. PGU16]
MQIPFSASKQGSGDLKSQTNMKALILEDGVRTTIAREGQRILHSVIHTLGPNVRMPARLRPGQMPSSDDAWHRLVTQVCVMGWSGGMGTIADNGPMRDDFRAATSLHAWRRHHYDKAYMAGVLESYRATRFPKKAADTLGKMAETPTIVHMGEVVLPNGLSAKMARDELRDTLIERRRFFRMKSASDFMISTGLSDDVIALDVRIVGVLYKYLGYERTAAQVQSSRKDYLSLETALRVVCQEAEISLAKFDRILFQFSAMSALEYVLRHAKAD